MQIDIPQIFWHGNRNRVMSIEFYPNTNYLVTCGAENESKMYLKFWEISLNPTENSLENSGNNSNNESAFSLVKPVFLYELNGSHTSTVNVCRFSPDGKYLATAGDDGAILIWIQRRRYATFGKSEEKIVWSTYKVLRGHTCDIYDLCWSPDSNYLLSGSIDNNTLLWNVEKGKYIQRFLDHQKFIQGVGWDPLNEFIFTQSSDKSVRFYKNITSKGDLKFNYFSQLKRYKTQQSLTSQNSSEAPQAPQIDLKDANNFKYYFADEDQCSSFFRRSAFSPDGKFLLLVSGILLEEENKSKVNFVVWGVSRKNLGAPLFFVPTLNSPATVVKFCPVVFRKKEEREVALIELDYIMIFAIGTTESVLIYGTDSIKPKYAISNIHYQSVTDLSWNGDKMLAISSSDGYISFAVFKDNELGEPLNPSEITWDDKFKSIYQQYLEIDINKTVMNTEANNYVNMTIKSKKKKTEEKNTDENNMQIEKDENDNKDIYIDNKDNMAEECRIDEINDKKDIVEDIDVSDNVDVNVEDTENIGNKENDNTVGKIIVENNNENTNDVVENSSKNLDEENKEKNSENNIENPYDGNN